MFKQYRFLITVLQFIIINSAFCQGICNFQPEGSPSPDNRQNMILSDDLKSSKEIKWAKGEIQAYCTFENSEKINLMFCEDSALNMIDEIVVSGKDFFFVKMLGKGIKNKDKHDEKYYCEAEFRISENAAPGKRTIKLKRPGMFHKEENIYTINLIRNVRITNYPGSLMNISKGSTSYSFYLEGQGLNQITGVKKEVAAGGKGIIESLKIESRTPNRINFAITFKADGQINLTEFIQDYLIVPDGTVIFNFHDTDGQTNKIIIKVGSN